MRYFGDYGGRFAPEILMEALEELEWECSRVRGDDGFREELDEHLGEYAGRPTPLTYAPSTSERLGFDVYLKREDLVHGGAHKLNNTLGQGLLAREMGKDRIIAETGAGQHGTATAMAGAALDLETEVYMGAKDVERQAMNVFRMRLMGATVNPVEKGSRTLKDAISETLRDWSASVEDTHYVIGSVVGPSPYPAMVREFQSVIGREAREQVLEMEGRLPDAVVACCGGGSNAVGAFHEFVEDGNVDLVAVEAGGTGGVDYGSRVAHHSASLCEGRDGVLQGSKTKILDDRYGQVLESHSVAPGLDYSGVGPELAHLEETGRIEAASVGDGAALRGFRRLSREEGIIPALESSHALAYLEEMDPEEHDLVIVNLSGRGDKDVQTVYEMEGER
ncbi:MAG: Tryptophan synthase beta chain 1 [Methanonatronarchaeales archaeon]|nr:Tryptophan synthase beta chain 1 [Methanonatronarchaeales archaeon]